MDTLLSGSFGPVLGLVMGSLGLTLLVSVAVILVLFVVPMCLIFKKAGREWWEAIIPFYNMYVLTVITGQPWWILIGMFIPFVNWITSGYLNYHLSKRFGFGVPFTLGLILVPFVFFPILGFGSAVYTKPNDIEGQAPAPEAAPVTPPVKEQKEQVEVSVSASEAQKVNL